MLGDPVRFIKTFISLGKGKLEELKSKRGVNNGTAKCVSRFWVSFFLGNKVPHST